MNSIAKKLMVYSLAGIMQVGFCVTMVAASPLDKGSFQRITQLDDRQDSGPGQPDQRKHRPQQPQREQPQPPQPGQDGPDGPGPGPDQDQ